MGSRTAVHRLTAPATEEGGQPAAVAVEDGPADDQTDPALATSHVVDRIDVSRKAVIPLEGRYFSSRVCLVDLLGDESGGQGPQPIPAYVGDLMLEEGGGVEREQSTTAEEGMELLLALDQFAREVRRELGGTHKSFRLIGDERTHRLRPARFIVQVDDLRARCAHAHSISKQIIDLRYSGLLHCRAMRYLHRFTFLAFEANAMLDRGKSLDIDETREKIDGGDLIDWFAESFPGEVDMSLYDDNDKREATHVLAEISGGANARRKFGVENGGLQLIIALCLQAIQGGEQAYARDPDGMPGG